MKLISKSNELKSLFLNSLKWCDSLYFATAWASPVKGLFEKLLENRKKIKLGVVGIHFYQTHPDFINEFIGDKKVKFVMQTSGTFHPKVYFFHRGDEWRLIVGSANLTNAAFSENSEVCVYMENRDDDNGDLIGYNALDILCKFAKQAEPFDEERFDSYKEIWLRQQRKLGSLSGRYGGAYSKKSNNEPKPVFLSRCLELSWKEYFNRVKNEVGKDHNFEKRKPVLSLVKNVFSKKYDDGTYVAFSDYSLEERKIIAGLPIDIATADGVKIDCGLFGSMRGNGLFAHYVKTEKRTVISQALDYIPREGRVEYNHFKNFSREIQTLDKVVLGSATRLLAMKRPDTFVCYDGKNAKNLSNDFGSANLLTGKLSTEERFELYWSEVICRIRDSAWWNTPIPLIKEEKFVWKNRAAFLDSIFYEN